jgi:hypothetical protein
MKITITKTQLAAIIEMTNDISSMIGCGGDADMSWKKHVLLTDRMLKKNGYKRQFK